MLQSGLTYRGARLAYKTHGSLNAARSNAVVYPTSCGAQHPPGKPVDPTKYFIIVNKFGNGLSSSPGSTPPFDSGRYPHFATTDNVPVQQRLLEVFGIERVALVCGFSMGAQQAFHWATVPRQGRAGSRRSAIRPRPRPTISFFSKASRRR